MILDSKNIKYTVIDITEPTQDQEKDFMQANATEKGITVSDTDPRHPLPPQIFNGTAYCGDYNSFELANECDTLEQFLKIELSNGSSASAVSAAAPVSVATTETNGKNGQSEEVEAEIPVPDPVVETPAANNDDAPPSEETSDAAKDEVSEAAGDAAVDDGGDAGADGGDAGADGGSAE